jgi:hypothetical protein
MRRRSIDLQSHSLNSCLVCVGTAGEREREKHKLYFLQAPLHGFDPRGAGSEDAATLDLLPSVPSMLSNRAA